MAGITYDTGTLIAAERNDRHMWALHATFLAEEVIPVAPAPLVTEAWRGGSRQASLSRLLAMCAIEPLDADHDDIVVVEGAARRGDGIVTSDRNHIELIARAMRRNIRIDDV